MGFTAKDVLAAARKTAAQIEEQNKKGITALEFIRRLNTNTVNRATAKTERFESRRRK